MHIRRWRNHAITQMRHAHANAIKQTNKKHTYPSHVIEVVESPVGGAEAERLLASVVPAHGLPVSPCGDTRYIGAICLHHNITYN